MPTPRYYIIDEVGSVFFTNDRSLAIAALDDGTSTSIDASAGTYFFDGTEFPIARYEPPEADEDDESDTEGGDE